MKRECVYNKKALKHFSCAVCYYCLSSFNIEELDHGGEEEVICPECEQNTILPVLDDDDLTMSWVGEMTMKFFKA